MFLYSDGTVVWQRSGGIQAFCSFTGLATIPFDVSMKTVERMEEGFRTLLL